MKIVIACAIVILCVFGFIAGSYGVSIYLQDQNNQRFCQYLESVVPRTKAPSNPAKNPSREVDYEFSMKTDRFERAIGCHNES